MRFLYFLVNLFLPFLERTHYDFDGLLSAQAACGRVIFEHRSRPVAPMIPAVRLHCPVLTGREYYDHGPNLSSADQAVAPLSLLSR